MQGIRIKEETALIRSHSTLRLYVSLELKQPDVPLYLNDRSNTEGVHMLPKCRLGYLWTMKAIAKTVKDPAVTALCRMCPYDLVENVEHFLLDCPAYGEIGRAHV